MRSAQDDDFVGALKKKIQTRLRFNVKSPLFSAEGAPYAPHRGGIVLFGALYAL
jgi:hypothetical protein